MKHYLAALALLSSLSASAQNDNPIYYPGDGMYIVGIPGNMKPVVSNPTLAVQAYQSKFRIANTELAAIKAGTKSYNLSQYFDDGKQEIDLRPFMGVGHAYNLVVRDFEGNSYQLGDYYPDKQRGQTLDIIAAYNKWEDHSTLPMGVYDHWDCPVTYEKDSLVGAGASDVVTVDFGNPHEGLVVNNVNFSLVAAPDNVFSQPLYVNINIYDEGRTRTIKEMHLTIDTSSLAKVGEKNGNTVYNVTAPVEGGRLVISTPFDITVSGLASAGVNAWLPRAVDTHGLYPTHTSYDHGVVNAPSDACINVEGYFNYLGTWGWWDGKTERGEVVSSADLVQIYYDPSDPDWPGDYFLGEAAFPVECTFGVGDITIVEKPEWIIDISTDTSQWDEYGCVQLIFSADALSGDISGRNGKIVLATRELASFYTIYVRQGAAWFDYGTDGITAPHVTIPAEGAAFDMLGRCISDTSRARMFIKGGKKYAK